MRVSEQRSLAGSERGSLAVSALGFLGGGRTVPGGVCWVSTGGEGRKGTALVCGS